MKAEQSINIYSLIFPLLIIFNIVEGIFIYRNDDVVFMIYYE